MQTIRYKAAFEYFVFAIVPELLLQVSITISLFTLAFGIVATLLNALVLQRAVPLPCLARSGAEWPSCWLSIASARAAGAAGQPTFGRPGRIEI